MTTVKTFKKSGSIDFEIADDDTVQSIYANWSRESDTIHFTNFQIRLTQRVVHPSLICIVQSNGDVSFSTQEKSWYFAKYQVDVIDRYIKKIVENIPAIDNPHERRNNND